MGKYKVPSSWGPRRADELTNPIFWFLLSFLALRYVGNCIRWGFGWGLGKYWVIAAVAISILLIVAGYYAIVQIEHNSDRLDDASSTESTIPADTVYGYGEILCAVGELASSLVFAWKRRRDKNRCHIWIALVCNWIGWVTMYVLEVWSFTTDEASDSQATQLVFHYAMMIMLWALNEIAIPGETGGKSKWDDKGDSV